MYFVFEREFIQKKSHVFLTPYQFAIIVVYEWTNNNFNDLNSKININVQEC